MSPRVWPGIAPGRIIRAIWATPPRAAASQVPSTRWVRVSRNLDIRAIIMCYYISVVVLKKHRIFELSSLYQNLINFLFQLFYLFLENLLQNIRIVDTKLSWKIYFTFFFFKLKIIENANVFILASPEIPKMLSLPVLVARLQHVPRAVFPASARLPTAGRHLHKPHERIHRWTAEAQGLDRVLLPAQPARSCLHQDHAALRRRREAAERRRGGPASCGREERRDSDW